MKRLLVDAGNTRLKWAWADRLADSYQAQDYARLDTLTSAAAQASEIWIASVAGEAKEGLLVRQLTTLSGKINWVQARARECGVINGYLRPEQLGADRWLALIAARARSVRPTLVVSAGTALTVDALDAEGNFLGGVIVPGMSLMRHSLAQGTAGARGEGGSVVPFPRQTADAVASGMWAALAGAVRAQFERLEAGTGGAPVCLVTGGDGEALLLHLPLPAHYAPRLVLEGLSALAQARSEA